MTGFSIGEDTPAQPPSLSLEDTLAGLPAEWPTSVLAEIRTRVDASGRTVVVLDDDPTGTQTVRNVPVLTRWSDDTLVAELSRDDSQLFYLLTNSRSLSRDDAGSLCRSIGHALLGASRAAQRDFAVVSRSDSTLRGHFPSEVDALVQGLAVEIDAWLVIPFFLEGGRYTIDDVHYVAEDDLLVPAGATSFAQDESFGYQSSNLRDWIEERSKGRWKREDVAVVSLQDLRLGGPERVEERLLNLRKGSACVVNAASYRDMEVFVLGLLLAEAKGRRYLYRTAASFVPIRVGMDPGGFVTREALHEGAPADRGGLIIVGSHVSRTTRQLQHLLDQGDVVALEAQVPRLLDDGEGEIQRLADELSGLLAEGRDVVVSTSRALVSGSDPDASLAISQRVSQRLVQLVNAVSVRPRFVIAKGGITSSDIATGALGMRRPTVLGQILPGVPVWRADSPSRYPGLCYVVFPGNVGDDEALAAAVERCRGRADGAT